MSRLQAPESFTSKRLLYRRPLATDVEQIFTAYAGDTEVTRYLGWPRHQSIADTQAFLQFCDENWNANGIGTYLIFDKTSHALLGSTGLELEPGQRAATGYVLRKSAWGKGFATEALQAMIDLAQSLPIQDVYALCHTEHKASSHVLEKCGLQLQATLPANIEFPNLEPGKNMDVLRYSLHMR